MTKKLNQIFKKITELEPSAKLESFILARIERERNKIIREKKALAIAGLFGSAVAAVYAVSIFGKEILQSDFWRIVSLAFSDINIVAGNWYDYALSLMETFPALHAALIITPAFLFLLSLNFYFNSQPKAGPPRAENNFLIL